MIIVGQYVCKFFEIVEYEFNGFYIKMFFYYFIFFIWQGVILCFLVGWDEIIVVYDMLLNKI